MIYKIALDYEDYSKIEEFLKSKRFKSKRCKRKVKYISEKNKVKSINKE